MCHGSLDYDTLWRLSFFSMNGKLLPGVKTVSSFSEMKEKNKICGKIPGELHCMHKLFNGIQILREDEKSRQNLV